MRENIKIEINAEQPVEEIVAELERLGFRGDYMATNGNPNTFVITWWRSNIYDIQDMQEHEMVGHERTVTLSELREMKND